MYNIVMITCDVGDIYTTDKEHVMAFLEQLQGVKKVKYLQLVAKYRRPN